MAKAESGLRQRIKKALEADGWSVVTQHGSAYSPNIPDLLVVLAALEVKTKTGTLEPGQRNRIRRFRKEGIPAGVVRTIEDARRGMAQIRQGAYQMPGADDLDLSYLTSLLADGNSTTSSGPTLATLPESPAEIEQPVTLDNLLGMQGNFETFTPTPAPDPEPEPAPTTQAAIEYQETARPLVDAYQSVLKQAETAPEPGTDQNLRYEGQAAPVGVPAFISPHPQMGVLEKIVMHLEHIDQMLTAMASGFGAPQSGHQMNQAIAAQQAEQPVRRRRRTKAEIEAAAAAGEPAEVE